MTGTMARARRRRRRIDGDQPTRRFAAAFTGREEARLPEGWVRLPDNWPTDDECPTHE